MTPSGCAAEYTIAIERMLRDEPCVMAAVTLLQSRCLRHGIDARWQANCPPTPSFAEHMRRYFEPFCKDAILSALSVGFVPYRFRRVGTHTVPEVLPLGTYSWSVLRRDNLQYGVALTEKERRRMLSRPLLEYAVSAGFAGPGDIFVYTYVQPSAFLACVSPLSSLITTHLRLIQLREDACRADGWNSAPRVVFEEQDKSLINDVAERGGPLHAMMELQNNSALDSFQTRQSLTGVVANLAARQCNVPAESTIMFAPRNNAARDLPRAEGPKEVMKFEMNFVRSVGLALGVPSSFLLQGAGFCAGSGGSTSGGGWAESQPVCERDLLDSVARISRMLSQLLAEVYHRVYSERREKKAEKAKPEEDEALPAGITPAVMHANDEDSEVEEEPAPRYPVFNFQASPTLTHEQLLQLYDAKLFHERDSDKLTEVALGYSTGPDAKKALDERHKAVNILPFRDKKETPS